MALLIIVALIAVALYLLKYRKKEQPLTVQELIANKSNITWDGLAQNGNVYRLVVEVEPINLDNASIEENKAVWLNFLGLINTISLPVTFIVQSQLFEMKDYTDAYGQSVQELPDEYPDLKKSGDMVRQYLIESLDQGTIRNYHGYIIFEYDPLKAETGVAGAGRMNAILDKAAPKKNNLSEEEKSDLALQVLEEAENILYGFCEQVGMRYQRLDKAGVWNYTYQTLQRELAPQVRMIDAIRSDSFKRLKHSLTQEELQNA
ncbi:hypothetical protein ACL02P_23820 [Paenibacillus sp. MB22_1]|uniref:hypothetical protein n=1 Tax=Paenibacillus sp. MB22_1 TaxID=3383121 RepID=UPI00208B8FC0|nr:hypothetical protein HMSSN139_05450 [Paenibacillus sp. HMSSN-139]